MEKNKLKNLMVTSREYKVLLDVRLLDRPRAIKELEQDLIDCMKRFSESKLEKKTFKLRATQTITFLDSKERFFNTNRLLLRQRRLVASKDEWELTLKSRSPDFWIGFHIDLESPLSNEPPKFEEDIGAPFVSKFSQSLTLLVSVHTPKLLADVVPYFPVIKSLPGFSPNAIVEPVNHLEMIETVYKGPKLLVGTTLAEFALIVWKRRDKGRSVVAECSFRYKVKNGVVDRLTSIAFASLFDAIQKLDWCSIDSQTKTQYIYNTNMSG